MQRLANIDLLKKDGKVAHSVSIWLAVLCTYVFRLIHITNWKDINYSSSIIVNVFFTFLMSIICKEQAFLMSIICKEQAYFQLHLV